MDLPEPLKAFFLNGKKNEGIILKDKCGMLMSFGGLLSLVDKLGDIFQIP